MADVNQPFARVYKGLVCLRCHSQETVLFNMNSTDLKSHFYKDQELYCGFRVRTYR